VCMHSSCMVGGERARTLSMLLAWPCQRAMRPDAQLTGRGIHVFSTPRNPAQEVSSALLTAPSFS
jgi:hypothetical protein